MRRGAEIELQATTVQAWRRVVGRNERDLVALADLADGDRDRALIGADNGADFFLSDQALRLGTSLLRVGLVIGKHQAHLGGTETCKTLSLRLWEYDIVLLM